MTPGAILCPLQAVIAFPRTCAPGSLIVPKHHPLSKSGPPSQEIDSGLLSGAKAFTSTSEDPEPETGVADSDLAYRMYENPSSSLSTLAHVSDVLSGNSGSPTDINCPLRICRVLDVFFMMSSTFTAILVLILPSVPSHEPI